MKLILASESARRKQILGWLVENFEIQPSQINEAAFIPLARTPEELVVKLAIAKAKKVKQQILNGESEVLILAADTDVIIPDEASQTWQVIGKPKDAAQAKIILQTLRNRYHFVYTGLCLINVQEKTIQTDFVATKLVFKPVSDEQIERYIQTYQPYDKAGSYGVQEIKDEFVESFDGSFTNIVGLPAAKTAALLRQAGVALKADWQRKINQEFGYKD